MPSYLPQSQPTLQAVTPNAGDTVLMTDNSTTGLLMLTPAGTLATLTVTLPSDANSIVNQERTICSSKIVTILTFNGATTIYGTITALAVGDCITFKKVATNTWARKI